MTRYGKLCTEFYDLDKPEAPPDALAFYLEHARRADGPILEPMCGSGRFLLPLLAAGFDVEGADISPDMLNACRARAAASKLTPVLHEQSVAELALERRFGLVLIPAGSFCLLTDVAVVRQSLNRVHSALLPGGRFVVEVERALPREPSQSGHWSGGWVQRPDGAKILLSWLTQYSAVEAIARSVHRYELVQLGELLATEFEDFDVKFYEPAEFQRELERAGFSQIELYRPYETEPPDASDDAVVFSCVKPSASRSKSRAQSRGVSPRGYCAPR